ncbi:class gamma glutathione S-transferase 2 [Absidia repens]|uniref:Class gamma glutathione S-transferase 2 n=1 Tax=Absidia repens TaxID=90262 RepID=A0A1X2I5U2_9FUNG|nr:class gamma glutathione S-transferase 2 [Absidia repens]
MTLTNVTLHYFNFKTKPSTAGFGENLNLLLKDAGVDFKYVRFDYWNWHQDRVDFAKNKNIPHLTLPLVEIDGVSYNKTVPTMRFLSKKLGKYTGDNDEEEYRLDAVADIVRDHFGSYIELFVSTDQEKLKEHFENDTKKYLAAYNNIYGENDGAYILGDEISYADFLVYHILDEDNYALRDHFELIEKDYPNVARFIKTFIQRPKLADYLASLKN